MITSRAGFNIYFQINRRHHLGAGKNYLNVPRLFGSND